MTANNLPTTDSWRRILTERGISSEDCTDRFHQAGSKLQQIPYQCRDRHHQRCCEALFYDMYARGITVAVILCKYSRWNWAKFVRSFRLLGKALAAYIAFLNFWICGFWITRFHKKDKWTHHINMVMVSTLDSESSDRGSNPQRTSWHNINQSYHYFLNDWFEIYAHHSKYIIFSRGTRDTAFPETALVTLISKMRPEFY